MPPIAYFHDFARHHRSLNATLDPDSLALKGPSGRNPTGKALTASISTAWKRLAADGGGPAQIAEVDRIRNIWNGGPAIAAPAPAPALNEGALNAGAPTSDGSAALIPAAGGDGNTGQAGNAPIDTDQGEIRDNNGTLQAGGTSALTHKRGRPVDMGVQTENLPGNTQAQNTPGAAQIGTLANIPFEIMPDEPPRKRQKGDDFLFSQLHDRRILQIAQQSIRNEHDHHHILRNHGADSGWKHCHQFAAGNNAATAVLAKTDEYGNVVDRVVVKDGWKKTSEWLDAASWSGDVRNLETREPMELTMHKRLEALSPTSQDRFSHVRSAKIWNGSRVVRLYLDYCDRNDAYYYADKMRRFSHQNSNWPQYAEPFLWHILEQLCLACKTLRQGDQDEPGEPWQKIVHRDMKPQNVFFTTTESPDEDTLYPKYPRVKLGDFGLAIQTSKDDTFNPTGYTNKGTEGFLAPEQTEEFDIKTKAKVDGIQLGSHTNVWGIGAIVSSMMVQGVDIYNKIHDNQPGGATAFHPYWHKAFSGELRNLSGSAVVLK